MERINILNISKIPQRSDEKIDDIFSKICHKLGITISFENDVCKTYRASTNVICVEFKKFEKKVNFIELIWKNKKIVNLNDIFDNFSEDQSSKIKFKHDKTKYYAEIETHLYETRKQGTIQSYNFTKYGFTFKKRRDSDDLRILSIEEFDKIINNNNDSNKN